MTKKLKQISLTLAAVMAITMLFAACNRDTTVVRPPIPEEIRVTRTYEALDVLNGDTYSLRWIMEDVLSMDIYRRGDDFSFVVLTILAELLVDGTFYEFDIAEGRAYYRPATEQDIIEMKQGVDGFAEIVDFHGATFHSEGRMEFMNYGEMDYEEFRDVNGEVRRAYFNDDGELFGVYTQFMEGASHMVWHISPEVPAHMFNVPSNLELVPMS
jgi:hypothetical protein